MFLPPVCSVCGSITHPHVWLWLPCRPFLTSSHGSIHYSDSGLPRGTPPTHWFVFILNARSSYTLYGVCVWSKHLVCVCAFYACTCTDKVISLGMSEFLHTSMQTCCMCVDQDTRHLDFSSFFCPWGREEDEGKKIFWVSGDVCYGAFIFRNNCF